MAKENYKKKFDEETLIKQKQIKEKQLKDKETVNK